MIQDCGRRKTPISNVACGSQAERMSALRPFSSGWRHQLGRRGCLQGAKRRNSKSPRAPKGNVETLPTVLALGRLFTISDEELMDHVEHANSKLLRHWREPRRGLQGAVRIGQTLLPSRFHRRAAELEVL